MRVRVQIDVRNPIKKTMNIRRPGGSYIQVSFRYERLGIFCFYCGILGHSDKFCLKLWQNRGQTTELFAYGPWLRAERRSVVMAGAWWLKLENWAEERNMMDEEIPTSSGDRENQGARNGEGSDPVLKNREGISQILGKRV